MKKNRWIICLICWLIAPMISYAKITVKINSTEHPEQSYGTVVFYDTEWGLLIIPKLKNLSTGLHGFHVHAKPSCAQQGGDSAGHYDPQKTDQHLGPYNKHSHLGDLPALYVNQAGVADLPILAPRLTEKDLVGRAIIIHQYGDNYADIPKKLGGGGARIGCGIIN